jgi:hypothetical protein
MSQLYEITSNKEKVAEEKRRILTIESYHSFQSSHENQTYNTHVLPLSLSPTTYVHSRECHLYVSTNHALRVWGLLSFYIAYVLLLFVLLFLSYFIRPFVSLFEQSKKESVIMMMTNEEKQQLTYQAILLESRSRISNS